MTHRLLLIDDDSEDRETVHWALESFGIDAVIREAPDTRCGELFLEQETFDCVLLDFHLPDGTGLELLNRIANSSGQARPPIILMTGRGDEKLAVAAMKLGACDYLVKGKTSPEQLVAAIGNAIDNADLERERLDAQNKMKKMALYDPLTGLANRYLFEETLDHAITLSQRSASNVCVLWMDLDGFKQINDTLGHHAGDLTLQEVGRRLNELTRNADTVSRLGGDEFVIIMESGVSDDGADTVAKKIADAMKSPIEIDGQTVIVGISIGIGVYPRDGKTRKAILEFADAAMYRAKSSGAAPTGR